MSRTSEQIGCEKLESTRFHLKIRTEQRTPDVRLKHFTSQKQKQKALKSNVEPNTLHTSSSPLSTTIMLFKLGSKSKCVITHLHTHVDLTKVFHWSQTKVPQCDDKPRPTEQTADFTTQVQSSFAVLHCAQHLPTCSLTEKSSRPEVH